MLGADGERNNSIEESRILFLCALIALLLSSIVIVFRALRSFIKYISNYGIKLRSLRETLFPHT